jgi:cation diffusion facilitator CzcD-associated flavoprotein CzcO
MDNAATALEAGAASLDLFVRRRALPAVNKFTGISSQGVVHGFEVLPDAWRLRFLHHVLRAQTPPRDSTLRVSRHPMARLHLGCPVLDLAEEGEKLIGATPEGRLTIDSLIVGIDIVADPRLRPELALVAPHFRV